MQLEPKPSPLCAMVKNKAIGAQKNFADTFNWMRSIVEALTEYSGFEIKTMDVVTDVSYDPSSHRFIQKKESIVAIMIPDRHPYDGEEVFTATPLSEEQ